MDLRQGARSRDVVSKDGLQILQESLGLNTTSSRLEHLDDVVFVSIDFEHLENIKQGSSQELNSQLGIAMLDTRNLGTPHSAHAISIRNYVLGSPSYRASIAQRFLFGETLHILREDILTILNDSTPRTRNIVLVGHCFRNDVGVLRALGFDLETSVVGILDTQRIASQITKGPYTSLSALLKELQTPCRRLHIAGHDAYYTLRALLLLAIKCTSIETEECATNEKKLNMLHTIKQACLPQTCELIHQDNQTSMERKVKRKEKKMEKKMERTRKRASKLLDLETQDRIRAERAAKRRDRGTSSSANDDLKARNTTGLANLDENLSEKSPDYRGSP